MFILKTRSDGKFSERALAVQALTESVGKDEIDTTKRAELVNRLLDILEPKKTKKKQPAPVGEDSK